MTYAYNLTTWEVQGNQEFRVILSKFETTLSYIIDLVSAKEKLGREKGVWEGWGGRRMDSSEGMSWYSLNNMSLLYVEGNV